MSLHSMYFFFSFFFFFNDTSTTEIYTLSLHDALPIYGIRVGYDGIVRFGWPLLVFERGGIFYHQLFHLQGLFLNLGDRKSTRLNSSHSSISYAVFCLKKKKKNNIISQYHHTTHDRTSC